MADTNMDETIDERYMGFEGREVTIETKVSGFGSRIDLDEPVGITGNNAAAGYALPTSILGATTKPRYSPQNDFLRVSDGIYQDRLVKPAENLGTLPQENYFIHEGGIDRI